jgi:probable rRNA maturation factor
MRSGTGDNSASVPVESTGRGGARGGACGGGGAALDVLDATGRVTAPDLAWLVERLGAALEYLRAAGEVRVRLVGDEEMSAAHERFGGVTGTTDVLTFDLRERGGEGEADGALDVDVLVCVDEAARQGEARGHETRRELLLYALHGVLHCLGEDDLDDASWARMHAREDEVLVAIGVGATFAREARGQANNETDKRTGAGGGR